ncbi:isochorismatase family protein [Georgenia sp. Z1491]|uniref:isochorismatase family protein n=1 Tax=Georgenia sp. Z1491 TaxID=3416707 RepID=UPI003CEECFE8
MMGDRRRRNRRALLVVDVQPTFCEGGALPVPGGNEIARRIAAYAGSHSDDYAAVVTTQDWHVDPGDHFSDTPDFIDSWPPHGVAGTDEAELHPALTDLETDAAVKKGAYEAAYSGFDGIDAEGRTLAEILDQLCIGSVDVVGLAESHCVKATALDARRLGLPVRVLTDLTAPVSPELGEMAHEVLTAAGVELVESERVALAVR